MRKVNLANMRRLISKMLAIAFGSLSAILVVIWLRSYSTTDMYDIRFSSTNVIELQTDAGYFIFQSAGTPLVPTHLFSHDSMGTQPLPGTAKWSFAGFSIRTFQWRFLKSSPAKIFVAPDWFLCLVSCIAVLGFVVMSRK
jgi:hypothetical protein